MPIDASYADCVIAGRADNAGDMGAMGVCIAVTRASVINTGVVVEEVPAMDIVNKPVAIIINSISGYFSAICPNVRLQIRMVNVHTLIDHAHNDLIATCRRVPREVGVNIGVHLAALPCIVQRPLLCEAGVVRRGKFMADKVGLRIDHICSCLQRLDCSPSFIWRHTRQSQTLYNLSLVR